MTMAGNEALVPTFLHFCTNLVNECDESNHFFWCWRNLANRSKFVILDIGPKCFRVIRRLPVGDVNNMGNIRVFSNKDRWAMIFIILPQCLHRAEGAPPNPRTDRLNFCPFFQVFQQPFIFYPFFPYHVYPTTSA